MGSKVNRPEQAQTHENSKKPAASRDGRRAARGRCAASYERYRKVRGGRSIPGQVIGLDTVIRLDVLEFEVKRQV